LLVLGSSDVRLGCGYAGAGSVRVSVRKQMEMGTREELTSR